MIKKLKTWEIILILCGCPDLLAYKFSAPHNISAKLIWQQREILIDKCGEWCTPEARFSLIIIFAMPQIRHSNQLSHNSVPQSED